jgi:hypothetical protein
MGSLRFLRGWSPNLRGLGVGLLRAVGKPYGMGSSGVCKKWKECNQGIKDDRMIGNER